MTWVFLRYKCIDCMRVITNYVTRSKRQPLVDFLTRIEQKTFIPTKLRKKNWNQSRRYYSKGFFNWMTESILKLKSFIYKLKTASWNKKIRYESTNQIRHDNSSIKDKLKVKSNKEWIFFMIPYKRKRNKSVIHSSIKRKLK